jgi:hypothetical protein
MTEQTPFAIGTVAQEAARLIEDMATMARSSYNRADDPSPYAGEPAPEPRSGSAPDAPDASGAPDRHPGARPPGDHEAGDHPTGDRGTGDQPAGGHEAGDGTSTGVCSVCGADSDATPASCRICPLCRGIALLRSVRPETVDLLADLALSVAAGLRDVASRSRASAPPSTSKPGPGGPADGERTTVQDIHVDDESE